MKSVRRIAGALFVLFSLSSAAAFAASQDPVRLAAAAEGQVIEAPGTDARAEVVTFGEDLAPALLRVAPEETIRLAGWPVAPGVRADVRITRFEIYAPDAKIWKIDANGRTEVPRSRMVFFRGLAEDDSEMRIFVAVDPGTHGFTGLALSPEGTYEIRPHREAAGGRSHLVTVPEYFLPDDGEAERLSWTCGQSGAPLDFLQEKPAGAPSAGEAADFPLDRVIGSLHSVTVAVDTDNELLLQKFADNTTNATNYVAALIAALNVIYERDLNIRLLQGTTFLRVSTTPDPYTVTGSGASFAQLNEFSNYWSVNNGAIVRGLAMLLSGKSSNNNSSSGIAWLTGLCSTSTGYSFSQVFKFAGSTGASDAFVVGHELGHNFGSPHTHCYSPTIDNCYNLEAGCYAGATSCPAAATINGVPNVRGTLMSYCHVLGGCAAANVFHSRTVDLITNVITPRIGVCVFPTITLPTLSLLNPNHGLASGGTVLTLTGTGFQNGATVSFGGTPAASVTFNNATQLTVTTPAHAAGLVNVVVTNPDTGSVTGVNAFTFDPLPTVSSLSPNVGTTAGGTVVTINGASFVNGATVSFGGTSVGVTFNSSTQLIVTAPAHATGPVSVTVTNPDTGAGTKTNAFFYTPPPTATDFFTLTPCRVLDTRNANGPTGGPVMGASAERSFPVAGSCGVPANAKAVVVNMTVISPTAGGYLSIDPGNAFPLGTAAMTFQTAEILSNNATLLLATDGTGTIRILNGASGTTHVAVDVTGYYAE
jgi:hypothetical protein